MKRHVKMFHLTAPIYQLFFKFETRYYSRLLNRYFDGLELGKRGMLLDLGSGTGAFALSWQRKGFTVKCADAAPGMVRKCTRNGLDCFELDVMDGLPFRDNSFHVVTAAYFAHGLSERERQVLYRESARVAEKLVVFHDFSTKTNPLISFIENLEGSYYRDFIKNAPDEMQDWFSDVGVIKVDPWNNWYICHP